MSKDIVIPLILRGEIIEDNLKSYGTRASQTFLAPDLSRYLDRLALPTPLAMQDLYALTLDEIIDYFEELRQRLTLDNNPHLRQAFEICLASSGSKTAEMMTASFRALPDLLRRQTIEEILEVNIGRRYLEDWSEQTLADGRTMAVRAFGARTAHIIAGNGQTIALQTVLYNGLTRGDAIIKLPSNDPYFTTAVARTMIEMAPSHPLTRHLSVAYWKGGDETIEKFLYDIRHIEKVVAWGGFDSMRSVRQYLQPGIDLVALDPKLSGSIIGREAFATEENMRAVAALSARDVGYFNQGGCVSARTIYVDTGIDAEGIRRANQFGKFLYEAIQALPAQFSTPVPQFDPILREEIEGIRYSEDFRIVGGKGNEGAVIVSQGDEQVDFSERLNCRVANVVPVANIDAAIRHLTIHTQTIGVYPNTLKRRIRDICALSGGQRIVPLGFHTVGTKVGPHDAIEPLRRMVRWIREDTMSEMRGSLFADE
jgi:hypothetical protein